MLIAAIASACGTGRKDHRSDDPAESPDLNGQPADKRPSGVQDGDSDDGDGANPATEAAGERHDTMSRAVGLHYYQWDARVSDLFSPETGTSQLCWPAVLAGEMEYLRRYRTPTLSALPEISRSRNKEADEIRYFATLCGTDEDTGTTVVQGVNCIDKHLRRASLQPTIAVRGVDAQWDSFFPGDSTSASAKLSLAQVHTDLRQGRSVILMLGYYRRSDAGWTRKSGHFVAVTGFRHAPSWGAARTQLRIMNPAVDAPSPVTATSAYETVELRSVNGAVAPDELEFEVIGDGFSDRAARAFVETAISFGATP